MQSLKEINNFVDDLEWHSVSTEITSREGIKIDTSNDAWHLPILIKNVTLHFERINSHFLKWAMKMCIANKIERTSSAMGQVYWAELSRFIIANEDEFLLAKASSTDEFKERLISLMEKIISKSKDEQKLWSMYIPIQWYLWCADNYSEIGFCQAYALELDSMRIPGSPKGENVRGNNPDKRPLHRSLELPLLIKALKEDKCKDFHCLQERAAMALTIAFGRNPSNLTYLKESDLVNLTENSGEPCFFIRMPRIKKGLNIPIDDFLEEYLSEEFASIIQELIEANKGIDTRIEIDGKMVEIERPIFINLKKSSSAIKSKQYKHAFNMTTSKQTRLIKDFTKRHNIISPITKEPLHITTRRLRYTLACGLAAEGVSRLELARILDHSDTQSVQVYYEIASAIIKHLDKAMAKGFAEYLDLFKGKIINNDKEAVNGGRDDKHLSFTNENDPLDQSEIGVCGQDKVCHLDPPYSCYLCPKFQPYRHADHEHVLECLLANREERMEKYEKSRIGIQLEEVIFAVSQVAKICAEEVSHV